MSVQLCSVSLKVERILFVVALIVCAVAAILLYVVGLEDFSNPEQSEYIITSLLYIGGLVAIRGLWKLTLDGKIRSKKERENEY